MSESAKMEREAGTADTIILRAGDVLEIEGLRLSSGQTLKSANAYVASVLQTGKVIGNGPGETELWIEENQQPVQKMRCVVQDGGGCLFPILLNRYNGIPGPAGRLVPLVQEHVPEDSRMAEKLLLVEENAAAFMAMYAAAREQGVWLLAISGFSEHHSGLVLDVSGGYFQNGQPVRHKQTAWKWLAEHCHEYGFMVKNLPGKEEIAGTRHESWHVRYLGNFELCRYLYENQLTLDEYLDRHGADAVAEGFLFFGRREIKKIQLSQNEYEHVRLAADGGKEPIDATLERMARSRDVYGVPFKYYHRAQLYKFTEKSILGRGRMLQKAAENNQKYYETVCAATGRTVEQVRQDLAVFNDNPYAKVSISQYSQLRLYQLQPAAIEKVLIDLRDRIGLKQQLTLALEKIDRGEDDYGSISVDLERYYQLTERTLLFSDIEEVRETIEKSNPEILKDERLLRETVADMVVCRRLMGFMNWEYFMFGFLKKSFQERRTFVSGNYWRIHKLSLVNNRRKGEVFDNKSLTYELFKAYYGRSVVAVNSEGDFENFENFCKGRSGFVKKPINAARGQGIGPVQINESEDLRALFASVYDEIGPFICEERIKTHPAISALNPDFVNTVRVNTYHDGNSVNILWIEMKIGRAGSFVDNFGAGGILVAIDENTGTFISDGIDESGNRYEEHPDNGIVFRGYQLPDWQSALALGRILGRKAHEVVPEVAFIGWDFTYTGDERWIVVEGNANPGVTDMQGLLNKSIKAQLDQLIPG